MTSPNCKQFTTTTRSFRSLMHSEANSQTTSLTSTSTIFNTCESLTSLGTAPHWMPRETSSTTPTQRPAPPVLISMPSPCSTKEAPSRPLRQTPSPTGLIQTVSTETPPTTLTVTDAPTSKNISSEPARPTSPTKPPFPEARDPINSKSSTTAILTHLEASTLQPLPTSPKPTGSSPRPTSSPATEQKSPFHSPSQAIKASIASGLKKPNNQPSCLYEINLIHICFKHKGTKFAKL